MLEKRYTEQDTVLNKTVFVSEDGTNDVSYQMKVHDYVVRVSNSIDSADNGGTITITLPNVVEAAGRIYTIVATDIANAGGGTAGTVVVTTDGDEDEFAGDHTFTASGDLAVMYSDGFCWHTLNSITT